MSRNEAIVSKRYFEQRFLDGFKIKAPAFSCKIGLSDSRLETSALFIFVLNMPPFFVYVAVDLRFSSPVSPARARDMSSRFSALSPPGWFQLWAFSSCFTAVYSIKIQVNFVYKLAIIEVFFDTHWNCNYSFGVNFQSGDNTPKKSVFLDFFDSLGRMSSTFHGCNLPTIGSSLFEGFEQTWAVGVPTLKVAVGETWPTIMSHYKKLKGPKRTNLFSSGADRSEFLRVSHRRWVILIVF